MSYLLERNYILNLVLHEFLGISIEIKPTTSTDIFITPGDGKGIRVIDVLFQIPESMWLQPASLPKQPLKLWDTENFSEFDIIESSIPVIYGADPTTTELLKMSENEIELGLDIFGSAFFMLTRYEEVLKDDRDQHDRFPSQASLAYQENFLDRPIIDEYVRILRFCIEHLWPCIELSSPDFNFTISHDIDRPFRYKDLGLVLKSAVSALAYHNKPYKALDWLSGGVNRLIDPHSDPFYLGIIQLMEISEQQDTRGIFNFMAAPKGDHDFGYNPASQPIQQLIHLIRDRSHEIGFHPGYSTFNNIEDFLTQKEHLERACGCVIRGGRQHYLRFKVPETWRLWEEAQAEYDSSMGYADIAGFRCGVCRPYTVYDLLNQQTLNLKERPLIVMDGQLQAPFNEGLSIDQAYERTIRLAEACRQVKGEFVLLWHNSSLSNEWEEWGFLYRRLVTDLAMMLTG